MNDRELLERAAKAAGVPQNCYRSVIGGMWQYTPQDGYFGACWNPLDDDGDALRMAVKREIALHHFRDSCAAAIGARFYSEPHGSAPAAAARRAIVRAAAAMAVGEA